MTEPYAPYCYPFPRPAVTADIAVFKPSLEVLLIRRKSDPYAGKFALPGGFVEIGESLEAAAARELKEETRLEPTVLKQFRAFGDPDRDPRGRTITIAFWAFVSDEEAKSAKPGYDAADATWMPVWEALQTNLAFDHGVILEKMLASLEWERTLFLIAQEGKKKMTLSEMVRDNIVKGH